MLQERKEPWQKKSDPARRTRLPRKCDWASFPIPAILFETDRLAACPKGGWLRLPGHWRAVTPLSLFAERGLVRPAASPVSCYLADIKEAYGAGQVYE